MKAMKPVLWTALGMALGVTAALSTRHVEALSTTQEPSEARLVVTYVTSPLRLRMYVVHDPKTNGCWLASQDVDARSFSSMAVAPLRMCLPE